MSPRGLVVARFGPFAKGVADTANPSGGSVAGALRYARNAAYTGYGTLKNRPGTEVALTLKDDQGTPASVTSVCAVAPFGDGALAVAHSTVTNKVYLYRLTAALDGWYNSAGTLTSNLTPQPLGVLWSTIASPPVVTIAEGLGAAYVAHNAAADSSALNWPTKTWDGTYPASITSLVANGSGGSAGTDTAYFLGVVAYQQHLWGWGYGSGATAAAGFRPELLRFSQPNFGALQSVDNFAVGHRVRSQRERVTGAFVAGEVLYVCTNFSVWPVVGYGRDSWEKSRPLDDSYGCTNCRGAVAANGALYYWSYRGLMRVAGLSEPEPLFDAVPAMVQSVTAPQQVVLAFDADRDQVLIFYGSAASGGLTSQMAAYDIRRDVWLGPDASVSIPVAHAAQVQPIYASTSQGPAPAGPPTSPSTTFVSATTATANWTAGDTAADTTTTVEWRRQGTTTYTVASPVPASQTSYAITGLATSTAYEWRVKHTRNGQDSAYLGPVSATQFTTASSFLNAPKTVALSNVASPPPSAQVTWVNTEPSAQTEVWYAGPSVSAPSSGSYYLYTTVDPGVSSADICPTTTAGTYWAKCRHKSGAVTSAFAGPASAALTAYNFLC